MMNILYCNQGLTLLLNSFNGKILVSRIDCFHLGEDFHPHLFVFFFSFLTNGTAFQTTA